MNTKTYSSIGKCQREAFCAADEVIAVCVNAMGNTGYIAADALQTAQAGAHFVKGAAVAFDSFAGRCLGIRYMVLQQLTNGDFLYQEKTVDGDGRKRLIPGFIFLFEDEMRARSHFQRATMRHKEQTEVGFVFREIPFPGMSNFNQQEQEKTRVLH